MRSSIRELRIDERKYTYGQSAQIKGQTGAIGCIYGDFGGYGTDFHAFWKEHNPRFRTEEFDGDTKSIVGDLRSEECDLFKSLNGMRKYIGMNVLYPVSFFKTPDAGFRVDTEHYSYLIRCMTKERGFNFNCECYVRQYLDKHIEKAANDIRFIDSHYRDLFRLPDGDQIRIVRRDGSVSDRVCRYIDDAHVEIGNSLFHICEFAERMEASASRYKPKEMPLPPYCFGVLSDGEIVRINRYESRYLPLRNKSTEAESRNKAIGVNNAQAAAMIAGAMLGWDHPAAKPKNYDEEGKRIKKQDLVR